MSFDIFLKRFADDPAGEAQREAALAVLRKTRYCGPDDYGTYFVTLPGAVVVELLATELEGAEPFHGCAFRVRERSRELFQLILDIARAGDMVILPVMAQFTPILVTSQQVSRLPRSFTAKSEKHPVCTSAEELEVVLTQGLAGWRRYRERTATRI